MNMHVTNESMCCNIATRRSVEIMNESLSYNIATHSPNSFDKQMNVLLHHEQVNLLQYLTFMLSVRLVRALAIFSSFPTSSLPPLSLPSLYLSASLSASPVSHSVPHTLFHFLSLSLSVPLPCMRSPRPFIFSPKNLLPTLLNSKNSFHQLFPFTSMKRIPSRTLPFNFLEPRTLQ